MYQDDERRAAVEDILRSAYPPANPEFQQQLRAELLQRAAERKTSMLHHKTVRNAPLDIQDFVPAGRRLGLALTVAAALMLTSLLLIMVGMPAPGNNNPGGLAGAAQMQQTNLAPTVIAQTATASSATLQADITRHRNQLATAEAILDELGIEMEIYENAVPFIEPVLSSDDIRATAEAIYEAESIIRQWFIPDPAMVAPLVGPTVLNPIGRGDSVDRDDLVDGAFPVDLLFIGPELITVPPGTTTAITSLSGRDATVIVFEGNGYLVRSSAAGVAIRDLEPGQVLRATDLIDPDAYAQAKELLNEGEQVVFAENLAALNLTDVLGQFEPGTALAFEVSVRIDPAQCDRPLEETLADNLGWLCNPFVQNDVDTEQATFTLTARVLAETKTFGDTRIGLLAADAETASQLYWLLAHLPNPAISVDWSIGG